MQFQIFFFFPLFFFFFFVNVGQKKAGKSGLTKIVALWLLFYPGMVVYLIYAAPTPKMEVDRIWIVKDLDPLAP